MKSKVSSSSQIQCDTPADNTEPVRLKPLFPTLKTQNSELKTSALPAAHKRIIGLTGGIGTGKTTVANYLAQTYHLPVFDADIYAREAVEPVSPILTKISERYGSEILLSDGSLDRKKLGQVIFTNTEERKWVEQQIHPYVRQRLVEASQSQKSKSKIVLVVPLLFESNMMDLATEIWVVYCSPAHQLERLMQRDRLTLEQAQARINAQMPIEEKCERAGVVLDNSFTLENLLKQVDIALNRQTENGNSVESGF